MPTRNLKISTLLLALGALPACTFNFELTSQRTALENQVMGAYKELEDDVILASSVRAPGGPKPVLSESKRRAVDARQNQDFNRDDIDELKDKEMLGEANDGNLALLEKGKGLKLAVQLVGEENKDREEIRRRVIDANSNLSEANLPEIRKLDAKRAREELRPGQWYQDEAGAWQRKI
jgi:uncharacterized protein YdbL (DUF1318 family)